MTTAGVAYETALEELSLKFRDGNDAALKGKLKATIQPDHTIALRKPDAAFSGDLPELLNQPAVLPGHALTRGVVETAVSVSPNGDIKANTKLKTT